MAVKITRKAPKVGDKLKYLFSSNSDELCKEIKKTYGLKKIDYHVYCDKIEPRLIENYKTVTVLEVTQKGRFLVVQDEEGNLAEVTYHNSFWSTTEGHRNDIPLGVGVANLIVNY